MAAERRPGSDLSVLFELFVVSQRAGSLLREVMAGLAAGTLPALCHTITYGEA